jgi:DNA processing protein
MDKEDRRIHDWLALSFVDGLGKISYRNLIRKFGSPDKVFQASIKDLEEVEGLRQKVIKEIKGFNQNARVKNELELMRKHQVTLVTFLDENYSFNLLNIYDPPPFLYVKGEFKKEDKIAVAIVGSRFASHYGKLVTERISQDLALEGVTVVSGMARGIDTSAHRGALSVKGRTIAVLGCGIDINYPAENKKLREEIASNGALVSEFKMSTPPASSHFPVRNRIISGLSLGVVVIEASHRSGSLITARLALEQGRDVFAVPGSVDSLRSRGTHKLIKEGAKLVEDAQDVVIELLPQIRGSSQLADVQQDRGEFVSEEARSILELLEQGQLQIDKIITGTGLSSSQVSTTLLDLELNGLIRQLPGKVFVRKQERFNRSK